MRCRIFARAAFCLTWVAMASGQCEKPSANYKYVVAQVTLERHLAPAQEADIKLRVIGRCFDDATASELSERVLDAFQNQGYFRARVQDPIVRVLDQFRQLQAVAVTFDIDPGEKYYLGEVRWTRQGKTWTPSEDIAELQPMSRGDVFDTSKVRLFQEGLQRLERMNGDTHVVVPMPTFRDHQIDLTFDFEESKPEGHL